MGFGVSGVFLEGEGRDAGAGRLRGVPSPPRAARGGTDGDGETGYDFSRSPWGAVEAAPIPRGKCRNRFTLPPMDFPPARRGQARGDSIDSVAMSASDLDQDPSNLKRPGREAESQLISRDGVITASPPSIRLISGNASPAGRPARRLSLKTGLWKPAGPAFTGCR